MYIIIVSIIIHAGNMLKPNVAMVLWINTLEIKYLDPVVDLQTYSYSI